MGKSLVSTRMTMSIVSIAILLLSSSLSSTSSFLFASAKEVEVTSKWTLLGENDTIPAGVHVRMDMTTGEKWVKLIDENDDDGGDTPNSGGSTTTTTVEVDANGNVVTSSSSSPTSSVSVAVTSSNDDETGGKESSSSGTSSDQEEEKKEISLEDLNYDYDMMYRTLSQLPEEEQERMGLPDVPSATKTTYQIDRQVFEKRMKEIWIARQEELQLLQEEMVADLPKLLKTRIKAIASYLEAPYDALVQLDLDAPLSEEGEPNDDEDDENNDVVVSDILLVLKDLEYHLSDLDMARDFHTLGGWPLLVSLISKSVHEQQTNTTTTPLTDDELRSKIGAIQAHASWAVGTMVKNTEDFFPFAVQKFDLDGTEVSAMSLLVELLEDKECNIKTQQKVLYALGSLLRGNRLAQEEFELLQGPSKLSAMLVTFINGDIHDEAVVDKKIVKRILTLVDDLVTDVVIHPGIQPKVEKDVLESFTTKSFCESSLTLLQAAPSLQETALQTVHTLAPYCQWDDHLQVVQKEEAIEWLQSLLLSASEEMDEEYLKEQTQIVESILKALKP